MIIGIIAAMNEELEILLKDMHVQSTEEKAKMTFNKGSLWGKEVIAVVCGVGKVNAAICTQILASEYKVDKVINVGVAGGIGKDASDLYNKGIDSIFSIVDKPMTLDEAMENAEILLEDTAERIMRIVKLHTLLL